MLVILIDTFVVFYIPLLQLQIYKEYNQSNDFKSGTKDKTFFKLSYVHSNKLKLTVEFSVEDATEVM